MRTNQQQRLAAGTAPTCDCTAAAMSSSTAPATPSDAASTGSTRVDVFDAERGREVAIKISEDKSEPLIDPNDPVDTPHSTASFEGDLSSLDLSSFTPGPEADRPTTPTTPMAFARNVSSAVSAHLTRFLGRMTRNSFHNACVIDHSPKWSLGVPRNTPGDFSKHRVCISSLANPWRNIQWWALIGIMVGPSVLATSLFGLIPLGEPNGSVSDKGLWIGFFNPVIYSVFTFLMLAIFYSVLDETKPFRSHWLYDSGPVIAANYILQVSIMLFILPFTQTFPFVGLLPFAICTTATITAFHAMEARFWPCKCAFYGYQLHNFTKVVIAVSTYIIVLTIWVVTYRNSSGFGQALLAYLPLILVFIWKKILLSITDVFPLELAMLISGFWLENLDDIFQTLVFPSVADGALSFFFLYSRKILENVAYLVFLTEWWFAFRVWIKDFLKRLFTCHLSDAPAEAIHEDRDSNDRGHSNQKPGYQRRQLQFFIFKIFSQATAYMFFMISAPILRHGPNNEYYPLTPETSDTTEGQSRLTSRRYRDALVFSAFALTISIASGLIAWWYVRSRRHSIYRDIKILYHFLLRTPIYLILVGFILLASEVLALMVVQYHYRIWFFDNVQPPGEHAR
eukprot:m.24546 g.24546  ORF g.24546 m.24546 type:complete len:624 (-) comp4287_c0_seq1:139-2010(-)